MIGIIITGHGRFAEGMLDALEVVSGPQEALETVNYQRGQTERELRENLQQALCRLSKDQPVLFLCDLAGGLPYRIASELAHETGGQAVAGINLGMLIEVSQVRQFVQDIEKLADQAAAIGKDQVEQFVFRPLGLKAPKNEA